MLIFVSCRFNGVRGTVFRLDFIIRSRHIESVLVSPIISQGKFGLSRVFSCSFMHVRLKSNNETKQCRLSIIEPVVRIDAQLSVRGDAAIRC